MIEFLKITKRKNDKAGMSEPVLKFSVELSVRVEAEDDFFVSCSPALNVFSQGETEDAAVSNLIEAVQLFISSCYERGTLHDVLEECGFTPDSEAPIQAQSKKERVINVPLPFAHHAQAQAC